jgi:hypothetical protein
MIDLPKDEAREAWKRQAADRAAWHATLKEPIAELARLAKIPADQEVPYCRWPYGRLVSRLPSCLSAFEGRIYSLLRGARQTALFRAATRGWNDDRPIKEVERALRAAYAAVRALSEQQRGLFEQAADIRLSCNEALEYASFPEGSTLIILEALVEASSTMTGRSPTFAPRDGRGRPAGTVGDWQFRTVLGALWQATNECGGNLTFSCKGNEGYGTMVEALEILSPLLPTGFIPRKLPAKTIERVKATLHTEVYWGFPSSESGP